MKMIPTPRILQSERNKDWTITGAISELIDNSLGADRGDADEVRIYWEPKTQILKVADNGRGMKQMSYLFRLGEGDQSNTGHDIGKYGQGGSSALLWLPDEVLVWTVRDGRRAFTKQNIHQIVDVDGDWLDVEDRWTSPTLNNVPAPLNEYYSGTLIAMALRRGRKLYPDVVRRELSKTYAAGLRKGRRIIWITGSEVTELQPFDPGDLINVDEFEVEVQGLRAKVKAGIGETITQRDAGISVTFGHRQITKTREPLDGWDGGKVFGWVDLGPEWHDYLSNNKTCITDDVLWAELMDKVHIGIQPLLDLLDQEAEQEFAAKLSLEANLQFGALINKVYKRKPKPEPVDDEEEESIIDDEDEGPKPKPEPKPKEPKGGIEIVVKSSRELEGRIMDVRIHVGDKVMVLFDPDSDLMKEARQSRPLNRLLMRSLIADEFSSALIRQELVVESGLYTAEAWEQLMEDLNGDRLQMASYVKPRLFSVIGETKKEEEMV